MYRDDVDVGKGMKDLGTRRTLTEGIAFDMSRIQRNSGPRGILDFTAKWRH